jgi:hypothetical protein
LEVCRPPEVQWKPPLRQAAGTLTASGGQCSGTLKRKNGTMSKNRMENNSQEIYDFGDAWFLTTLIVLKDWADIKGIISVGDGLNHAIFTQNEINQALKRLIPVGYIEANGKKYRASEKAYELTNCVDYKRAGAFTQIEVILKRLNKKVL